jgi:spore coat polysaccharide biosynthesis protein SpsF (cytidylyltransferase family)
VRIGALVPVRLASERLPAKALADVAGRPAITHLLDRLFAVPALSPDRVVVCTTEDETDDPLVPLVEAAGARVFRGSRDDLVDRLYHATRAFGFDAVIEADGDDPCSDAGYAELALRRLHAADAPDVVTVDGLPLGVATKAIRASAIERVWERHVPGRNDTGFMYYFTRAGLCSHVSIQPVSATHRHATARLTLDYPEDLAFFRALFGELHREGPPFGVAEIVALLDRRPDLLALNAGLDERYWARTRALVAEARLEYRVGDRTMQVEV